MSSLAVLAPAPHTKIESGFSPGHLAARRILVEWKGDFVGDATHAAYQVGLVYSGSMISCDAALDLVRRKFDFNKVDAIHWSSVYQSFLGGRDTVISAAEVVAHYLPVAANDNFLFDPTVFEWSDPAAIPTRDWLYGSHLCRGYVSLTIASGAVGKTSLKIVEALSLATGRSLLGQNVPRPIRVWLFNLEDDAVELRRRVSAAMIYYNIKPDDIGDRLHIDGGKALVVTKTTRTGTVINEPVVDAVIEAVLALEIDVLFVDPFISSHDAPESDSGAMDLVMKSGWVRIVREGNCAVELCHHTTKADTSSGLATAMSGRGSGAVVAACRSVQVLNKMTLDESKKAGLPSPAGYFSSKDDKENLTPEAYSRDWYKMASVSLGNGGKGNLAEFRSDNIGVVTRWHWPTAASFLEGVTPLQVEEIKERLKAGEYRRDGQAKAWAGYVISDVLDLGQSKETLQPGDKARVARMLDAWITAGVLKTYEQAVNRDPKLKVFVTAA
jgi:hypothetical protein